MIKFPVLFLALILATSTASLAKINETATLIQIPFQQCKSELKANEDDAKIMVDLNRMPENEVQSCLLDCFADKVSLVKDGKVDKEIFMKIAKLSYSEDIFRKKENEMEHVFSKCQQEVEKRSKEKCGSGVAMRSCSMLN